MPNKIARKLLLTALLAVTASAQHPIDLRGTIGTATFVDDSNQVHGSFGGSARYYITRRFSIEPEIAYLRFRQGHHDWLFMPNVVFDFRSMEGGKRVIPYVIGGGGYLWVSEGIVRRFTVGTWVAEGGGGAKIYLNRNVFIAPEARVGSQLYLRATVSVGYTFRR